MKPQTAAILESCASAGWVVEPLARRILTEYGLPVTQWAWARDLENALEAAAEVGYPLVVKVVSPRVIHKSDVGGVIVGVEDEQGVREAYRRMARLPGFEGVLLDEVADGLELIVGAKHDPQFGPVVLTGIGGTAVEIYQDVAIRMAPMSPDDAESALDSLRARKLLEGFRGAPPVQRESLVDLLVRFSEMAHDLGPAVDSIDLNPVFCGPERCVIADARIMLPRNQG
ncbi:acetate--CoA ligase family protein [Deferrisoma camini]|uniref:acetate--CoA ligase family protein n=1 Tax=Deferrisoma camini TaxID=1035120 RepID=UPI00046D6989|nr:acetate--CoA ligase family protein [Deferrisoma camini]